MTTRRGFTLVELTAVLLVAALAAGAVALRISGPTRKTQLADAVGAIEQFDAMTRVAARQQARPMSLVIDAANGRLERCDAAGGTIGEGLSIAAPLNIRRVLWRGSGGGRATYKLPVSVDGCTPTYAIELLGPGQQAWLAFAGLSGQRIEVNSDRQFRKIIEQPSGPDAR